MVEVQITVKASSEAAEFEIAVDETAASIVEARINVLDRIIQDPKLLLEHRFAYEDLAAFGQTDVEVLKDSLMFIIFDYLSPFATHSIIGDMFLLKELIDREEKAIEDLGTLSALDLTVDELLSRASEAVKFVAESFDYVMALRGV